MTIDPLQAGMISWRWPGSLVAGVTPGMGGYAGSPQLPPQGSLFGSPSILSQIPQGLPQISQGPFTSWQGLPTPGLLPLGVDPLAGLYARGQAPSAQLGSISPWMLTPFAALPMSPLQATNVELQAMNSLMQDATSATLRKLYDYLDKHSQRYKPLETCIPLVKQAVDSFRAGNYLQAFTLVFQTYRFITLLRSGVPDLPNL